MVTDTQPSMVARHTDLLAKYIAAAADSELPESVSAKTRMHLLDSLAAMVSGSQLRAGRLAAGYVALLGGAPVATVVGGMTVTSTVNAALANGMMGHADETDDSHLAGRFHPGCAIVPAALAVAEQIGADGPAMLRAVALGYDVGARVNISLGYARPDTTKHSTHSIGPCFGAMAAAACLLRLNAKQVRHALSYAAQQASGIPFWQRDAEHVEKAFDFGGMGARNGVTAATMVAAGFTAVDDPLSGRHNLFTALGESPEPEHLVDGLGTRFEIMRASIKKWSVGSPIQAALDGLVFLMVEHHLEPANVHRIVVHMPDDRLHIVNDRTMPDVCLQHLLAVTLLDGDLSFAVAHDKTRMDDPTVREIRARIHAVPSPELTAAVPARQAIVEIETDAGERLIRRTRAVRGTPDNPMTMEEVAAKARDLMAPVLGGARAATLVATLAAAGEIADVRALRPLLQA